jgi:hypothetical protein
MLVHEARQLLVAGLPPVPPSIQTAALGAAGQWPVLLALINGAVGADVAAGGDPASALREIVHAITTEGPSVLDIGDELARDAAVARTIEVSLMRLTVEQRDRYGELAVFGRHVAVPGAVLARYWSHTAGWSPFITRRFCQRLADLALVSDHRRDPDWIQLHDIVHAYLRERQAPALPRLHQTLVAAHRDLAPRGRWAALPATQEYLWTWLPAHLADAGLGSELDALLDDPKWLVGKLEQAGPAGLESDLRRSPAHVGMATVVQQNAHVLAPLEPQGSLAATLASRLGDDEHATLRQRVLDGICAPHLALVLPSPDRPHPALRRCVWSGG